MNSNIKTAGNVLTEGARGFYRVAIVGAASLKGKEVAEMLDQRNFPTTEVKLLDDDETLGQLESLKDEITFIQAIRADQFEHLDFIFFASDADCTRKTWKQVQKSNSAIVDLSYALQDQPGALIRAPWVERQLNRVPTPELQPGPAIVAHPASVVMALLLARVQTANSIVHASTVVLGPASEYGQKGMDELHQQTVNLLSFQPLPKKIFDIQVAFNMVSRFGDESGQSLKDVNDLVTKHYREIVDGKAPVPSVLTLEAPVFHSHSIAINLRLEKPGDVAELSAALAGEHVTVVASSQEAPNNVNAAGQGEILVSIATDPANPNSVWLWAALDNLRVAASSAVECAESMEASRPRGQIQ